MRGNIEIGVNPGMVFTSLTRTLPAGPFVVTVLDGPNQGARSAPFTIVGGADPDGSGPDGPTSCGPVFPQPPGEQAPA